MIRDYKVNIISFFINQGKLSKIPLFSDFWSIEAVFRLMMPWEFAPTINRILYFDVDMIWWEYATKLPIYHDMLENFLFSSLEDRNVSALLDDKDTLLSILNTQLAESYQTNEQAFAYIEKLEGKFNQLVELLN